jgi:hypothetical protein
MGCQPLPENPTGFSRGSVKNSRMWKQRRKMQELSNYMVEDLSVMQGAKNYNAWIMER